MTAQVYGWLTIIFFVVLVALVVALFFVSRRRDGVPMTQAATQTQAEADQVKDLTGKVQELEHDNAKLKEQVNQQYIRLTTLEDETDTLKSGKNMSDVLLRECESAKERLSQEVTNLKSRMSADAFQYRWLFTKVATQGQSLSSYVEVEKVYTCYHKLDKPMLKSVFGIDFRNKSVFDVSVEKAVVGHIKVEGTELEASPLIVNEPGITGIGGKGTITLEQRLTRPEADYIASQDPNLIEFDLTNLTITIKGEGVSSGDSQHLKIPKRLHADPQVEITSLKSELAAAKANIEKPDITGEIKNLHIDDQLRLDKEPRGYDFFIIIQARIVNHRAEGSIEQIKLMLRLGEDTYNGERVSLDGYYQVREESHSGAWEASTEQRFEDLEDIETDNQIPLKANNHRLGWLRFTVFVPEDKHIQPTDEIQTLKLKRLLKEDAEIILTVVDGRGVAHGPIIRKAPLESTVDIRRHRPTAY